MDRLSELLGQAVQFAYTCWDRIVLTGYIERLQRPENLIYFFHDVVRGRLHRAGRARAAHQCLQGLGGANH